MPPARELSLTPNIRAGSSGSRSAARRGTSLSRSDDSPAAEARFYSFLKEAIVAFAKGLSPIVAVEFARRSVFHEHRPTFAAMEAACKSLKAK